MQGKPSAFRNKHFLHRITPAGAGKTCVFLGVPVGRLGSPPQVRGKRQPTAVAAANLRITPAGAGKTATKTF